MGRRLRVGLALGGGAARGVAHVGVLRAFAREGVPVDLVLGTSMGAIVGGAFAASPDVGALERKVHEVLTSEEFRNNRLRFLKESKSQSSGLFFSVANLIRKGIFYGVSSLRPSFISAESIAGSLGAIVPDVPIESLATRFGAVALDIDAAKEVVICHGGLRRAVEASSAIPGILPPVGIDGRMLVDGGWVNKVPVLPAFKLGAHVVIAVDISADLEDSKGYDRGLNVMLRANAIRDRALVVHQLRLADVVIEPEVKHVHWADFDRFEECMEAGDEAASRAIPGIRRLLRRERFRSWFRPTPGRRAAEYYLRDEAEDVRVLE